MKMGSWNKTNYTNGRMNSRTSVEWFKLSVLWLLVATACVGNIFIILVKIAKRMRVKNYRKLSDTLIAILSCLDLLKSVTFFLIETPPTMEWRDHKTLCKGVQKTIMIAFSISSYVTLWLTCSRYYAICRPLKEGLTKRKNLIISLFIVVLHSIYLPDNILNFSVHASGDGRFNCEAASRSIRRNPVWFIIEITSFTFSVSISAIAMSIMLKFIRTKLSKGGSVSESSSRQRIRQNKNASKVLLIMYIAYMTSYIPWVSLYVMGSVAKETYKTIVSSHWSFIIYVMVAGSFCNSFLTYLVYSLDFRRDMMLFLKSILPLRKVHLHSQSSIKLKERSLSNANDIQLRKTT